METILNKFINNNSSTGLLLCDAPTGSGKTTAVINIIEKFLKDKTYMKNYKRIIYCDTRNEAVNSVYKDTKSKISFTGGEEQSLFLEKSYRLDKEIDEIKKGYNLYKQQIDEDPKYLKNLYKIIEGNKSLERLLKKRIPDFYDDLKFFISKQQEAYDMSLTQNNTQTKKYLDEMSNKIITTYREISHEIVNLFPKKPQTVKQFLKYIKKLIDDPKFVWLKWFCPTINLYDKQLLYMTTSKFCYGHVILGKKIDFNSTESLQKTLIIFDEIDNSKEKILDFILDQKNSIEDELIAFHNIYEHINEYSNNKKLPSKYHYYGWEKDLDEIYSLFKECYKIHKLNYTCVPDDNLLENKYYLFTGQQNNIFTNSQSDKLYILNNTQKYTNIISQKPTNKKIPQKNKLKVFEGDIWYCIFRFISWAYWVITRVYNKQYKKISIEINTNEYFKSIDEICDDLLFDLRFTEGALKNYLKYTIVNYTTLKTKKNKQIIRFDNSFYNLGFSYTQLSKHGNAENIEITKFGLHLTPEKWLINIADKTKIIGLSATATIKTTWKNFDIEYLKDVLQQNLVTLSDNDNNHIKEILKQRNLNYYNNKINIQLTDLPKERIEYNEARRNWIINVIKNFIFNNHKYGYLFTTPKWENIDFYINEINLYCKNNQLTKPCLHFLNINNRKKELDKIERELNAGKRVFVFTNYDFAARSFNLQYKLGINSKTFLDYVPRNNKQHPQDFVYCDMDYLALEKPTNVIPHKFSYTTFYNGKSLYDEIKTRHKVIYHLEALKYNGLISDATCKAFEKKLLLESEFDAKQIFNWSSEIKLNPHTHNAYINVLAQATGRSNRTDWKNSNIEIVCDQDIFENIDFQDCYDKNFTPEFNTIINYSKKYVEKQKNKYDYSNIVFNKNIYINNELRNKCHILYYHKDYENMIFANKLKDFLMKNPTCSGEEPHFNEFKFLYFENPNFTDFYSYDIYPKSNLYDKIGSIKDLSFNKNNILSKIASFEESSLSLLFTNKEFKDFWINQGFATKWKKNKYIMAQYAFAFLYAGEIGEQFGIFIFNKYFNINLQKITEPEKFEQVDYILSKHIGIDFKYWHPQEKIYDNEEKEKLLKKCKKLDINIIMVISTKPLSKVDATKYKYIGPQKLDKSHYVIFIPNLIFNLDNITWGINWLAKEEIIKIIDRWK